MMDFTDIWLAYHHYIHRYITARIHNPHDAAELTDETFLRALTRWASFTDDGRGPGPWLTTIAHNLILDMVKSRRYQREIPATDLVPDRADTTDVAEHVVDMDERRRVHTDVHEHLDALTPSMREVINVRFMDELDRTATASRLGCSVTAAKQRQLRAIKQLRAAYGVDHEKVRHAS